MTLRNVVITIIVVVAVVVLGGWLIYRRAPILEEPR